MDKTAIVIFSDPKNGTEEALGRVFNGLAAAYDFLQNKQEVKVIFQGAGTRWPAELENSEHPAHSLYKEIEGVIEGISCGCADVFGAETTGMDLITNNPVPGTTGVSSFVELQKEGYSVLMF